MDVEEDDSVQDVDDKNEEQRHQPSFFQILTTQAPCVTPPGDPEGACIPCIKAGQENECGPKTFPSGGSRRQTIVHNCRKSLRGLVSLGKPKEAIVEKPKKIHGNEETSVRKCLALAETHELNLTPAFDNLRSVVPVYLI